MPIPHKKESSQIVSLPSCPKSGKTVFSLETRKVIDDGSAHKIVYIRGPLLEAYSQDPLYELSIPVGAISLVLFLRHLYMHTVTQLNRQ